MSNTIEALKRQNHPFMWVFVLAVIFMISTPVSVWVEDSNLSVRHGIEGDPLVIDYDGSVKREFLGEYGVIIRETGTGQVICDASGGPFPYKVGGSRPDPLLMSWWAVSDPRCYGENIPAGEYEMSTCWSIRPIIFGYVLPFAKRYCKTTNPFTRLPRI